VIAAREAARTHQAFCVRSLRATNARWFAYGKHLREGGSPLSVYNSGDQYHNR
jgi:hypothetical protein